MSAPGLLSRKCEEVAEDGGWKGTAKPEEKEEEEVGSVGLEERLEGPDWEGRDMEGAVVAGWRGRLVTVLEGVTSADWEGRWVEGAGREEVVAEVVAQLESGGEAMDEATETDKKDELFSRTLWEKVSSQFLP